MQPEVVYLFINDGPSVVVVVYPSGKVLFIALDCAGASARSCHHSRQVTVDLFTVLFWDPSFPLLCLFICFSNVYVCVEERTDPPVPRSIPKTDDLCLKVFRFTFLCVSQIRPSFVCVLALSFHKQML